MMHVDEGGVREDSMDAGDPMGRGEETSGDSPVPWDCLPPEIIEIIGGGLHEGHHLQSASLVSKSWRASIPSGRTAMEIDMHPDPSRWQMRSQLLAEMMNALRVATIFINDTVPANILCGNLELMGQLSSLEVRQVGKRDSVVKWSFHSAF
eukprot:gene28079-31186_t